MSDYSSGAIEVNSREELEAILGAPKETPSKTKQTCKECGTPCGKKIWFSWYKGARLIHYPKCKLLEK